MRSTRSFLATAFGALACTVLLASCAAAAASPTAGLARKAPGPVPQNLLTYHYRNGREGVDGGDGSFLHVVRAWYDGTSKVSGADYGEPLVYDGQVIVATEEDDVYSLSARTGRVLWKVALGRPVSLRVVRSAPRLAGCGDIDPLGVTGTPVIDAATRTLYVVAEVQAPRTHSWQQISHRLYAVDLASQKILWSRPIDPAGAGDGRDGTYEIPAVQQRAALSLANGRIYVEYGGLAGDCAAYHGFVVSVPAAGNGPLSQYTTPSPREDAIWATSGAAVSPTGDLYVATGNGSHTRPGESYDFGNSVIELSPSLEVLGYFAPDAWRAMSAHDLDLGSDGPILLPGGRLVFQSGKPGYAHGDSGAAETWGYLLDTGHLGGIGHPVFRGRACPGAAGVFGSSAATLEQVEHRITTVVFVPCASGTAALALAAGDAVHPSFHMLWTVSSGHPNGPPIVAGGLVWAISTGSDGGGAPANVLSGINPLDGAVVETEALPPVDNFVTPAAGDGIVVVGTSKGVVAFRERA